MRQLKWQRLLTVGAAGLLVLALTAGVGLTADLTVDTSLGNTPFAVPPDITYDREIIGNPNTGVLNQSGGTNKVNFVLILGQAAGSSGTYNLSGGSLQVGNNVLIGNFGTGTFTQTGGTHTVTNSLILGFLPSGTGTYNLSGGSLSMGTKLIIGDKGQGTFTQTGGTVTVGNDLRLGELGGSGTYNFLGGSLSVGRNYTQSASSTLAVGISSPTSYARIPVGGTATLGGILNPVLLNGFVPQGNQVFSGIISAAGGLSGSFTLANSQITPPCSGRPFITPTA